MSGSSRQDPQGPSGQGQEAGSGRLSSNNPFRRGAPSNAPRRGSNNNPFLDPQDTKSSSHSEIPYRPKGSTRAPPSAEDIFGDTKTTPPPRAPVSFPKTKLTTEQQYMMSAYSEYAAVFNPEASSTVNVPSRQAEVEHASSRPEKPKPVPPVVTKLPPGIPTSKMRPEERYYAEAFSEYANDPLLKASADKDKPTKGAAGPGQQQRVTTKEGEPQRKKENYPRRKTRGDRSVKHVRGQIDIIDKLDATSTMGAFHHPGPYDAASKASNDDKMRRAPMRAFAEDSLNSTIIGHKPRSRHDHDTFMGVADSEAFRDYATVGKPSPSMAQENTKPLAVWDPLSRGNVLHGDVSMGLGSSTFLEGTPAARTAVKKQEETLARESATEGLQRKKSLAQRIRGMNRPTRDVPSNHGPRTNPEGVNSRTGAEPNPFFPREYKSGGDDDTLTVRRPANHTENPRGGAPLERRSTTDTNIPAAPPGAGAAAAEQGRAGGGGLLARVKSLKSVAPGARGSSRKQRPADL